MAISLRPKVLLKRSGSLISFDMSEPFNSIKHATAFLMRRGVASSTEYIGSIKYLIIKRKIQDDLELNALIYLKDTGLHSTMDRCVTYRPWERR